MSPASRWLLSALVLLIGTVSAVNARQSRSAPAPWWKTDWVVKELQLGAKQIQKIDYIFNETRPELEAQMSALDEQEKALSRMIKESPSDATVKVQIDLVESTRARRNTARAFMLYRMRNVLTSEQRAKFDGIHAKWSRDYERQRAQSSQGSKGSSGPGAKKLETRPATPARP